MMERLASIVVGLDFSACSRVALDHAWRIATWAGAQLHPVHVVDAPVDVLGDDVLITESQGGIRASLTAEARQRWSVFVGETPGLSHLRLDVAIGHRLTGIRGQLDRHQADLLVLGAFGEERPNVGMGTLASACIRSVPTDVLVVRDTYREPFRTVVVGIDFSATSRRALEAAARVAHNEGAELYAAHVVPARFTADARLRTELLPKLEAYVNDTTSRYPGLELRAKVYPYSGYRSGLVEFGALVNADLVVVGTRGQTNLRDVVLGSTAEKVIRDGLCAVWAVKPDRATLPV
jgi:nucleotide-binding universal stress UspA family protein